MVSRTLVVGGSEKGRRTEVDCSCHVLGERVIIRRESAFLVLSNPDHRGCNRCFAFPGALYQDDCVIIRARSELRLCSTRTNPPKAPLRLQTGAGALVRMPHATLPPRVGTVLQEPMRERA